MLMDNAETAGDVEEDEEEEGDMWPCEPCKQEMTQHERHRHE